MTGDLLGEEHEWLCWWVAGWGWWVPSTRELDINQDGLGKDIAWVLVSTWSLNPVAFDKVLNLSRSPLAQKQHEGFGQVSFNILPILCWAVQGHSQSQTKPQLLGISGWIRAYGLWVAQKGSPDIFEDAHVAWDGRFWMFKRNLLCKLSNSSITFQESYCLSSREQINESTGGGRAVQRKEHGATVGMEARLQKHLNASLSWDLQTLFCKRCSILSVYAMEGVRWVGFRITNLVARQKLGHFTLLFIRLFIIQTIIEVLSEYPLTEKVIIWF